MDRHSIHNTVLAQKSIQQKMFTGYIVILTQLRHLVYSLKTEGIQKLKKSNTKPMYQENVWTGSIQYAEISLYIY